MVKATHNIRRVEYPRLKRNSKSVHSQLYRIHALNVVTVENYPTTLKFNLAALTIAEKGIQKK